MPNFTVYAKAHIFLINMSCAIQLFSRGKELPGMGKNKKKATPFINFV